MRYFEIAPTQSTAAAPTAPATPQQARVRGLQQRVAHAQSALKAERKAQKLARAQATINTLRSPQVLLK